MDKINKAFEWLKTRPTWLKILLVVPGFLLALIVLGAAIARAAREQSISGWTTTTTRAAELHDQSADATKERQAAELAVSRQAGELGQILDDGRSTVDTGLADLRDRGADVVSKGDSLVESDADLIARARRESGEGTGGEGR